MRIGYHASHEQHQPRELLAHARLAEEAGFETAMCSDHLMPWSSRQASSGFTWSWLASALEATDLPFGTVCAPGDRYHPVVIAQAAATLGQMYPGRFWLALGSGERLNEHITGREWPPKEIRNERLAESVHVIRRLLAGESVTHDGYVTVEQARLYVRPEPDIPLYCAALTAETAAWGAGWADGLITAANSADAAAPVIDAFRGAGGATKPVVVQVAFAWAESAAVALAVAYDQWRQAALAPPMLADLPTPEAFDAAVADIPLETMREVLLASANLDEHARRLQDFTELDVDAVYLHNVALNQPLFVETFGREVLPLLRGVPADR